MDRQETGQRKRIFVGGSGLQPVMYEGEWKAKNRPGNLIRMEQEIHTPTMRFIIRFLMTGKEFMDLRDYRKPPIQIAKICGIGTDGTFDEEAAPANIIGLPKCTMRTHVFKRGEPVDISVLKSKKRVAVKGSIFKRGIAVLLNTGEMWAAPESKVENLPETTRKLYQETLNGEAQNIIFNRAIVALEKPKAASKKNGRPRKDKRPEYPKGLMMDWMREYLKKNPRVSANKLAGDAQSLFDPDNGEKKAYRPPWKSRQFWNVADKMRRTWGNKTPK